MHQILLFSMPRANIKKDMMIKVIDKIKINNNLRINSLRIVTNLNLIKDWKMKFN